MNMEALQQFLQDTALQYPLFVLFALIMTAFRMVFKPAMALAEKYVLATPSKSDDESLDNFKKGKAYAAIIWVVDFLTSIKIEKFLEKKEAPVETKP